MSDEKPPTATEKQMCKKLLEKQEVSKTFFMAWFADAERACFVLNQEYDYDLTPEELRGRKFTQV